MQVRGRQGERGERIWKVHLCAFSCSQHCHGNSVTLRVAAFSGEGGCSGEHLLGLVLLQAILVMAAFQMLQLVLVFFISCE